MPSPPNITNIPALRVPLIDERTGLMTREWYRFFLNLFTLTGSGSNDVTLQDLQIGPQFDPASISATISSYFTPPVVKTANFTVAVNDFWIINNKPGSPCVATLPMASAYAGKILHFLNYQPQTLVSASSNVVPLAGGGASTAILEPVSGANATLVSDGANWVMTQYDSNNSLELE